MSTSRRKRTPAPPAVPSTTSPLTPDQVTVLHKVYAILLAHSNPAGTP